MLRLIRCWYLNANWILWALLAVILWGVQGYLVKLVAVHTDWKQFATLFAIGEFVPIVVLYLYERPQANFLNLSSAYALASGIVALCGIIAMYLAFEKGKVSIVVTITALYPLITILLSVFLLRERITTIQGLGIFLAIIGMVLMTR